MIVKKALRPKKSAGGRVTHITYTGTDSYSKEQIDIIFKELASDEVKMLLPFETRTNEIILRSAASGYSKYDIVATNNYNTYLYEVQPSELIEITSTGTGYGSSTTLGGAFYSSDTTVDSTTALASAFKNADSRKIIGTAREIVPQGAVTFAVMSHKNNTVTVKSIKFSRLGAVEDKLSNIIIPYNEWFNPYFNGQLAYDSTTGNKYFAYNNTWIQINT